VTTRGFGIKECQELAGWMCEVLDNIDDEQGIERVKEQVVQLCRRFPVYDS